MRKMGHCSQMGPSMYSRSSRCLGISPFSDLSRLRLPDDVPTSAAHTLTIRSPIQEFRLGCPTSDIINKIQLSTASPADAWASLPSATTPGCGCLMTSPCQLHTTHISFTPPFNEVSRLWLPDVSRIHSPCSLRCTHAASAREATVYDAATASMLADGIHYL